MKITLIPAKGFCEVKREATDKKYYGIQYGKGESNLLHDIKKELNKLGWNFIKKRMWKDGHLVDDMQQYLREAKPNKRCKYQYAIFNPKWAIEGIEKDFNAGCVILSVENLYKENKYFNLSLSIRSNRENNAIF